MIYAVKTIIGRENVVMEAMSNKARVNALNVKSFVHPEEIKGFIFIEGEIEDIQSMMRDIPHARGIIRKPVPISDLKRFLKTRKREIELNEGDIIEIIGGPFKGEKGKITRYDKVKGEVTIELIEVTVPIPVTVNAGLVKVVKKVETG